MTLPAKIGPPLEKDADLAFPRHGKPPKESKSLSRYPAPARTSRPPKESKGELAKVLRDCNREFNRRIIQRDTVDGKVKCISCPAVIPASQAEPGHFERRGHWRIRLHPHNVNGQCHRCNCDLGGNRGPYREGLVEKIGEPAVLEIESMKGPGGKPRLPEAKALLVNIMAGKVVT